MPVVLNPDSALAKELKKWDTPRSQGGMKCDGFEPYPKMLYMAHRRENGKVLCGDNPLNYRLDQDIAAAEAFTAKCQMTVRDDAADRRAQGQGWCETPDGAIAAFEAREQAVFQAAAEAAHAVTRMSEPAQREFAAADPGGMTHVTDVEGKSRRRGRRVTVATATQE